MDRNVMLHSAMAGLLAAGVSLGGSALGQDKDKMSKDQEKCWGVAKAGQNDCGSNKTAHSCAGQAKADYDANDFKVVKAGTCVQMGGSMTQGQPGKLAKEKQKS